MLPIQRKAIIMEQLLRKGGCSVKELTTLLGISEMTVRRDLKQLAESGQLKLTHGGAVPVEVFMGEPAVVEKEIRNPDGKERLAAYAVRHFVSEGDVIVLEGGTTVSRMCEHLPRDGRLTILTNGLETLNRLRRTPGSHTVLASGGILREVSGTFVGPVAEAFFQQFHARTVFLSALGFTPEAGFTDPNLLDTEVKKAMIRTAERTVLLLDSSKFGQRSFTASIQAAGVAALITDSGIPDAVAAYFAEQQVPVHIVDDK